MLSVTMQAAGTQVVSPNPALQILTETIPNSVSVNLMIKEINEMEERRKRI